MLEAGPFIATSTVIPRDWRPIKPTIPAILPPDHFHFSAPILSVRQLLTNSGIVSNSPPLFTLGIEALKPLKTSGDS